MIDILNLTTSQQIRALLGVTSADLPDDMVEGMGLVDDLTEELYGWLEEWAEVRDSGTDRQQRLLRLYAKYQASAYAAASAQNFVLNKMSDGANIGERTELDLDAFNALRESLTARAMGYRSDLLYDLAGESETDTSVAVTLFGGVTPSRDPVTEGRS